jgi:hypothetical protein
MPAEHQFHCRIHQQDQFKGYVNIGHTAAGKDKQMQDAEEEGTMHFMVHVIQPQFNLHSEEGHVSLSLSLTFSPISLLLLAHSLANWKTSADCNTKCICRPYPWR